jgi:hypothetical protein
MFLHLKDYIILNLAYLRFAFDCRKWLSPFHDDERCDRLLVESQAVATERPLTTTDLDQSQIATPPVNKSMKLQGGGVLDKHMVLSIVRQGRVEYTRKERVSVCVCMLFLLMLSDAMWYQTEDQSGTYDVLLKIGPMSITFHSLYVSIITVATVYPIPHIIALAIKWAKRYNKRQQQHKASKYRKDWEFHDVTADNGHAGSTTSAPRGRFRPRLGTVVLVIAWVVLFLGIIVSAFFCLLYSVEWGPDKANQWLLSFFLSFIEAAAVVDPLMVGHTPTRSFRGQIRVKW